MHVDIECPHCGYETELQIEFYGKRIKASWSGPDEWPEVNRIDEVPDKCKGCEHVYTAEEWGALDLAADLKTREFDVVEAYEDMNTRWDED